MGSGGEQEYCTEERSFNKQGLVVILLSYRVQTLKTSLAARAAFVISGMLSSQCRTSDRST